MHRHNKQSHLASRISHLASSTEPTSPTLASSERDKPAPPPSTILDKFAAHCEQQTPAAPNPTSPPEAALSAAHCMSACDCTSSISTTVSQRPARAFLLLHHFSLPANHVPKGRCGTVPPSDVSLLWLPVPPSPQRRGPAPLLSTVSPRRLPSCAPLACNQPPNCSTLRFRHSVLTYFTPGPIRTATHRRPPDFTSRAARNRPSAHHLSLPLLSIQ